MVFPGRLIRGVQVAESQAAHDPQRRPHHARSRARRGRLVRTADAQLIPLRSNLELPEPDSCPGGGKEREQVIVFELVNMENNPVYREVEESNPIIEGMGETCQLRPATRHPGI